MDITDIRAGNVKSVMSMLRFRDDLTKKEVAQMTELSFSTVSNICNALKEKDVLRDEKISVSSVGRVPNKLVFQYNMFCSVCLDLQMENVLGFAVLDFRNYVLYQSNYNISSCNTPRDVILFARKIYDQILECDWFKGIQCVGAGVSVSGVFDRATRSLLSCAIPMMEHAHMVDLVEEIFNLPCYVDNESNLCALSMRQRSRDVRDLLYLHISQGVGLGVICNGKLLRGKNGYAAEISHMPLGEQNTVCTSCGQDGCLETDLSLNGLVGSFERDNRKMTMLQRWELKAKYINDGHKEFQPFLEATGMELGTVLSVLINLFDPEEVYIGGNINLIFDKLHPYIQAVIKKRCPLIQDKQLKLICDSESGNTIYCGINQVIFDKWNPLEGNQL